MELAERFRISKARLHDSMRNGRLRNFCTMIDAGAVNINSRDQNGLSPLILSCYLPSKMLSHVMARKLIQSGASLTMSDVTGKTALHHAVLQSNVSIIKLIMEMGFHYLTFQDCQGNLPLHLAVMKGDLNLVKLLLYPMVLRFMPSDIKNTDGMTPLLLACQRGRLDIARLLYHHGHHSPTAEDHHTLRNAGMWLDTVLFVPDDIEPFTCAESMLLHIRPKPLDYVRKDCQLHAVSYDWHKVACKQETTQTLRSVSATPILTLRTKHHPNNQNRSTGLSNKHSVFSEAGHSTNTALENPLSHQSMQRERLTSTILTQLFHLKSCGSGILPAAVAPPVHEAVELGASGNDHDVDPSALSVTSPNPHRALTREPSDPSQPKKILPVDLRSKQASPGSAATLDKSLKRRTSVNQPINN